MPIDCSERADAACRAYVEAGLASWQDQGHKPAERRDGGTASHRFTGASPAVHTAPSAAGHTGRDRRIERGAHITVRGRPAAPSEETAPGRRAAPLPLAPQALEEGLIRAGFLPPPPRRVRLARRVRRGLAGRLVPRAPARRGRADRTA